MEERMITVPAGWLMGRDKWKHWWRCFMERWELYLDPQSHARQLRLDAAKEHNSACQQLLDKLFP